LKKMKAGILALCVCAVPHVAGAQTMQFTDKGYVGVSGLAQTGSHDNNTSTEFDLYGEKATTASSQRIKSGGVFDIGGAYRVWGKNLLAGVSFSHAGTGSDVSVTGSIPDPGVFGKARNVSSTVADARHTENVIHLAAVWMMPVAEKLDLALFGGPSIFMVSQDTIGTLTVTEPVPTVTGPLVRTKKTTAGINLGVDVQYLVWHKVGVGGMARYTWGSVSLPGATEKLTVGGFQIGGGVRYRF